MIICYKHWTPKESGNEQLKEMNVMKFEKLGDIADLIMGQAPHSSTYNKEGIGSLLIKAGDFGLKYPTPVEYTTKPISFSQDDDILICVVGATSGKINMGINASITRSIATIRPNTTKLNSEFLFYYLKSSYKKLNKISSGSAQGIISKPVLAKIEIPSISIETQLYIAKILSKAENLISQRKESIRLLDEYLKSVFLEMFGEGNDSQFSFHKLDTVSDKITDGEHGTVNRIESGKLYLMARNIDANNQLDFSQVSYISEDDHQRIYKRCNPEKGDLLLVCVGATIGKVALVPEMEEFSLARSVALIKPQKDKISPNYLLWFFNSEFGQRQVKANRNEAAQAGLYTGKLKQIIVPVPPFDLQSRFSQIVEKTEALKSQYQQSLQELENLYGSLSQKAFKGELKLREKELTKQQAFLRKLMLASHIVYELCEEFTFGHTKLMKLLYLCEQVGGMALQTNYKKFAAGPFDGKTLTLIDFEYEKNGWFEIAKKSFSVDNKKRKATIYKKTEKSLLYKKHFDNYFAHESENINKLISLFRKETTQVVEIIATLYFTWKELMANNTIISENTLTRGFYEFHAEKKKFTREQIETGYQFMLKNDVYPKLSIAAK